MSETKRKPIGIECRFATHCSPRNGLNEDLHVVKERIHFIDGTFENNLRFIKNYERSFWITKPGFQKYQQKKEWEYKDKLREFRTIQSNLVKRIAASIDRPGFQGSKKMLFRNPYIYGADITSTALLKHEYKTRFPNIKFTPYSLACFDIETDVNEKTGENIIMATLSFKERVFTAVSKKFLKGQANCQERLEKTFDKYLGDYKEKRNIHWEVYQAEDELDVVLSIFKKAHEWQPDFISIWNIDFDIPNVIKVLEKNRIDPADVFSDPRVPKNYRFFSYNVGARQKKTASGKIMPIKFSAQWHTVTCPATFKILDGMLVYRQCRAGSAELSSYGLDNILFINLGVRKLKFEEANDYDGLQWHQFMQENYPFEYVVYNVFDCVGMEELDEKTNDFSTTLPTFSGISDFEYFNSQPRRKVDELHFECLEHDLVIATTSDEMEQETDSDIFDISDWIITLAAHLNDDSGLQCISENEYQRTAIFSHVGDLDVSSSYPNNGVVFNNSKETTKGELISLEGVDTMTLRLQGINLSGGKTNSVEFCQNILGLPTTLELNALYEKEKQNTVS